jgi:quercetin dioxygenase-like cupin family protein
MGSSFATEHPVPAKAPDALSTVPPTGNLGNSMNRLQTRRNFLVAAPCAVAAALPLTDSLLHAAPLPAEGQEPTPNEHPFKEFSAADIAGVVQSLQAAPGSKPLIGGKGVALSAFIMVEVKKTAPEFEYHEHRDHLVQILEGNTRFEVGGTPKNPHQTGPGEWLAPDSEGFTTYELKKGDMLSLPRMTPHKRITEDSVSFILIHGTTT